MSTKLGSLQFRRRHLQTVMHSTDFIKRFVQEVSETRSAMLLLQAHDRERQCMILDGISDTKALRRDLAKAPCIKDIRTNL